MLQTSTPNTFQERLNHLFTSSRATYRDVVDGTGGVIREAYLWQLRTVSVFTKWWSSSGIIVA